MPAGSTAPLGLVYPGLGGQLRSNGAVRKVRIHDLRHTFACRRLLQWYRDGIDIDHALASLSTYLGHRKVTYTYWYLSASGALLSIACERFERFASEGKAES
jgi:integrase